MFSTSFERSNSYLIGARSPRPWHDFWGSASQSLHIGLLTQQTKGLPTDTYFKVDEFLNEISDYGSVCCIAYIVLVNSNWQVAAGGKDTALNGHLY